jgi:deoxyribodipyrimidine photo-lyase
VSSDTALVLFTRDLRTHDHPALVDAARTASAVVPLYVFDDAVVASDFARPNRIEFLLAALGDLRSSLQHLGADLVVRRGSPVNETIRTARAVGASTVFVSDDVSAYAHRRDERLAKACGESGLQLRVTPGVTVVPPTELRAASGDHYRVFTPYWRAWRAAPWRPAVGRPRGLVFPAGVRPGALPSRRSLAPGDVSPDLPAGGETEGRRQWERWRRRDLEQYEARHDDVAGDATSRLSPYLHFGCLSPLALATDARERAGGDAFVRQLCWRDFHHQVFAAFPGLPYRDYRSRPERWRRDDRAAQAWRDGRTGYPIVDAGMRQLRREGWMHNRARLLVASFLTKDLGIDWRVGAAHFLDWLVDGDLANNSGNWQWVAGTGNDTRPNRLFNPLRQAERFDPNGGYVRRYVPELASIGGKAVHTPWKLDDDERRSLGYPDRIVDHEDVAASRARR